MTKKSLASLLIFKLQLIFGLNSSQLFIEKVIPELKNSGGVFIFENFDSAKIYEYNFQNKLIICNSFTENKGPNPLFILFKKKQSRNKKLTAAILAFPFPFGIVGLHRIYLGCPPYVPVAYIGSLGGMFGLIPLVDFWVIVFTKDVDKYANSKRVFMWVN